jgi:hypothetical protein
MGRNARYGVYDLNEWDEPRIWDFTFKLSFLFALPDWAEGSMH